MAEPNITQLLHALAHGDPAALDRLMTILYDDLRRMARAHLRQERAGHTLDSTALIHEAYMRLIEVKQVQWSDRHHFVAFASRVMRRVLTDYARARKRAKRGGGVIYVSVTNAHELQVMPTEALLDLDDTLVRLESLNERACRVVECRCFGGLSVEETAEALRTSPATVKRDWTFARAWLNRELGGDPREWATS